MHICILLLQIKANSKFSSVISNKCNKKLKSRCNNVIVKSYKVRY